MLNVTLWELIMLAIHGIALAGVIYLWRDAPDNVQRVVNVLLGVSLALYIVIDFHRIIGAPEIHIDRNLFRAASLPMQFAVLLYIGRLVQKRRDHKCRKSLPASD